MKRMKNDELFWVNMGTIEKIIPNIYNYYLQKLVQFNFCNLSKSGINYLK